MVPWRSGYDGVNFPQYIVDGYPPHLPVPPPGFPGPPPQPGIPGTPVVNHVPMPPPAPPGWQPHHTAQPPGQYGFPPVEGDMYPPHPEGYEFMDQQGYENYDQEVSVFLLCYQL